MRPVYFLIVWHTSPFLYPRPAQNIVAEPESKNIFSADWKPACFPIRIPHIVTFHSWRHSISHSISGRGSGGRLAFGVRVGFNLPKHLQSRFFLSRGGDH